MSKSINLVPFAVGCDGTVFFNLAEFDGARTLENLLRLAKKHRGAVFIGLPATPRETRYVTPSRWFDGVGCLSGRW